MTTKTILVLAAGALLIGGIWYAVTDVPQNSGDIANATTTPTAPVPTSPVRTVSPTKSATPVKPSTTASLPIKLSGYNSVASLLAQKEPLQCAVKVPTLNRSGTIYVSGGKMRANLKSYVNGALTNVSMINDTSNLYVWKNGATTGLQLSAVVSASGSAAIRRGGLDLATEVSFSCTAWTVDASLFTPPATVTFSINE